MNIKDIALAIGGLVGIGFGIYGMIKKNQSNKNTERQNQEFDRILDERVENARQNATDAINAINQLTGDDKLLETIKSLQAEVDKHQVRGDYKPNA